MELETGLARWAKIKGEMEDLAAKASAKAKEAGGLSARDRVTALADDNSFVEIDALNGDAAIVAGFGLIDGRPAYILAHDYSVLAGSLGAQQAKKTEKILELAEKTGAPVITLVETGGVRLTDGVAVLAAYASLARSMSRLSGVVPQIAVVLGPCVGGAALLAASADVVILAEKAGAILALPPQVFSAKEGKTMSLSDIGGAKQAAASGLAALTAKDEQEALALARAVVGYLPCNSAEDAPFETDADDFNRLIPELDAGKAVDVRDVLRRVADSGAMLEMFPEFGKGVVTALARLGGRSVGVIANAAGGAKMCAACCDKAARFVTLCDSFNLPVVSFVDCAGLETPSACANADMIKAGARVIAAFASATVPCACVIMGDAVGMGYLLMGGKGLGADITLAWPDAVIAPMAPEAMVQIFASDELSAQDPAGSRDKLAKEYVAEDGDAVSAARGGFIDDVIAPSETRQRLIAALEMLIGKSVALPPRKHGVLPL